MENVDSIGLHEIVSGIDFVYATLFAARTNLFSVRKGGETSTEIAQRAGLSLHKSEALIRAGLHLKLLNRDGDKVVPGEKGWGDVMPTIFAYIERAHRLQAAIKEDFFEIPEEGEEMPQMMQRTGISPLQIPSLINTGTGLGLIKFERGKLALTELGNQYVTKAGPYSMRQLIQGLPLDYEAFVEAFVKGKHPPIFANDPHMINAMVHAMHQKSAGLASYWPTQVDLSEAETFLDIGAGSGVHTIEACKRFPNLHGIAVDLPHVAPATEKFIAQYGMEERITTFPLNAFTEDLPPTDTIFMCDIIHDWGNAKALLLLRKAYETLQPGGRLIIVEVLLDGSFASIAFDISVLKMIPTEECGQRSLAEIQALLNRAGFTGKISVTPTFTGATILEITK